MRVFKERVFCCIPRAPHSTTRARLWNNLPLDIIDNKKFEDALGALAKDGRIVITPNTNATLSAKHRKEFDGIQRVKKPSEIIARLRRWLRISSRQ